MRWIRPFRPPRYRIAKARSLDCRTIMAGIVAVILRAKREGNTALQDEISRLLQPTHPPEDVHAT